jgi:hypothetical protein
MPPQGASYRGAGGAADCLRSPGLDGPAHLIGCEYGAAGQCSVIGQECESHMPPGAYPTELKIRLYSQTPCQTLQTHL